MPFLVAARCIPDAIQVQGSWLPMVVMDWVPGRTLAAQVAELAKRGDRNGLQRLSEKWQSLVEAMQETRMAHGDLQDGNIMVTDRGELCLVDYDTVYLPGLAGRTAIGLGTPGYVHPSVISAGKRAYDEYMDTFGALVILLSLRALAHDPGLYRQFSQHNLLLDAADLEEPTQSKAFAAIFATNTPSVTSLANHLINICRNADHGQVDLRTLLTQDRSSQYGVLASPGVVTEPSPPETESVTFVPPAPPRKPFRTPRVAASLAAAVICALLFHSAFLPHAPQPAAKGSSGKGPLHKHFKKRGQAVADAGKRRAAANDAESAKLALAAKKQINEVVARILEIQDRPAGKPSAAEQAKLLSRCQRALADSNRAIRLDGKNKDAWLQKVRALYYMGDYQAANADLKAAMASFHENTDFQPLKILVERKLRKSG